MELYLDSADINEIDASTLFKKTSADAILVTDDGKSVGMLDIQDLKANGTN